MISNPRDRQDGIATHCIAQGAGLSHGSSSSLLSSGLSPRSLLSTYEMKHMPPIKEMLELTTNVHTQSMSDNDLASKDVSQSVNPGFHLHSKKVNIGNKVYMPYGNEDERIQAGDRAPDAPNLVLVPPPAEPTTITIS
ncbi:hypothetical protein BS47DRAFT_1398665 [Hydnum rufescens UP504]|uniref:Uncharacterized protein n=1 Tax=Hydnum rufescens UP504 TaxID=1448309 RepID=A0A9P6AKD5_9AGAM|nr:hypothetical protein BS47DRAFT_1398665 [Hydnum rufescens UP504]